MKNFLFEVTGGNYDNIGELFFVQAERFDEVGAILDENFPDGIEVKLIDVMDDDDADRLGYDTF